LDANVEGQLKVPASVSASGLDENIPLGKSALLKSSGILKKLRNNTNITTTITEEFGL